LPGQGYTFVTGTNGGEVYVWDQQDGVGASGDDPDGTPSENSFKFFGEHGSKIAVAPNGGPWIVKSDNTIWRTKK